MHGASLARHGRWGCPADVPVYVRSVGFGWLAATTVMESVTITTPGYHSAGLASLGG